MWERDSWFARARVCLRVFVCVFGIRDSLGAMSVVLVCLYFFCARRALPPIDMFFSFFDILSMQYAAVRSVMLCAMYVS